MDHLQGYAAPAHDTVRERWRRTSADSVWLRPGDWYHPAVDALVEAMCEERDGAPAAERLGRARAEAGVGIGETLDDVACLYGVHDREPEVRLLRAVAVGWSEGYEATPVTPEVLDPESGLATAQYLVHRLRETYGVARRAGSDATRTHGLLVVDVALDDLTGWQRFARSAAMGRALTQTFGDGHPMASLGSGIFVVLGERGADEGELRTVLRHNIERTGLTLGVTAILRRPPRVWLEPLPQTHAAAVELLNVLQR
ncbi:hypothetical protein FIC82_004870 [Cellulosimicrobium protaetiae]|uniref:GGDEF domain-containing protein n=2 Tax=Cellulosimicrobium protaetiae TaxID=2587808 RepID=A0A6M5UJN2_9MICO|nr:hypothetical protein FIC82_004870 [Cellulosimicrobium protaetiae]